MPKINNINKLENEYNDYMDKLIFFGKTLRDESIVKLLEETRGKEVNEAIIEKLEKCEKRLDDKYVQNNKKNLEDEFKIKSEDLEKFSKEIKDLDEQIHRLDKKNRTLLGRIRSIFSKKISKEIIQKNMMKEKKTMQETLCMNEINSVQWQIKQYDSGIKNVKNCIKLLKVNARQQVAEKQNKDNMLKDVIPVDEVQRGVDRIKTNDKQNKIKNNKH